MSSKLPSIAEVKEQARRLRARLRSEGVEVGHSKSLELVAHQHGYRDWNTFHAAIGNRPPSGFSAGGRVLGRFLAQAFQGTVRGVEMLSPGWFRLELDLDDAVDVVSFASFSNMRKRVRGIIGPSGHSRERTSDGRPHLELDI